MQTVPKVPRIRSFRLLPFPFCMPQIRPAEFATANSEELNASS